MHPAGGGATPSRYERFTRLFLANQRRIFGFILAAVPDVTDADDLLQETNLAMWESFDEFDAEGDGADFTAWGITIARYRVMRFFRQRSNTAQRFSPHALEVLADEVADAAFDVDRTHEALLQCMDRLDEHDRRIIRERYHEDQPASAIADRLGLSVFTLYKRMNGIYAKLLGCIQRTLIREDAP